MIAELLPVPYFHLVFTVPAAIAAIALQNKAIVYDTLFRAAAETVQTIAADPKHLGAAISMTAVLHTRGQNLFHHPHVHCIVPGGGLSPDGRWIACRPGFFLSVRVLSRLYRRLFLERLQTAFHAAMLSFFGELAGLAKPAAFAAHLRPLRRVEWVVYPKRPFGGPQQVFDYLGRYTHRVAIANSRLIALADGQVRFRWKDYRHPQRPKAMTLPVGEFIRRFLLHILPDGFRRIGHFGFLANTHRRAKLALTRGLLDLPEPETTPEPADYRERFARLFGRSLDICLACGGHSLKSPFSTAHRGRRPRPSPGQLMIEPPTIAFRPQSTAPMPRVEGMLLLPSTSQVEIADATAYRDILCPVTVCRTSAAAHSISTGHVAARHPRHWHRWAHSQDQLP